MTRIAKDTVNGLTVSTVLIDGRYESVILDGEGETLASWRPVDAEKAARAHRELCSLAKLGCLMSYYAGSAATEFVRSMVEGRYVTVQA